MKETRQHVDQVITNLKEYINTRLALAQLQAVEKASLILGSVLSNGLIIVCLIMAFLFGSFALGFYFAQLLDNTALGFALVAGIYFLLALVAYTVKKSYLEKAITDSTIRKFLKDKAIKNEG